MIQAYFNWSGGKDSSLCLHRVLKEGKIDLHFLVTTLSDQYKRVSMHGLREELLDQQASAIGLPLKKIMLPEMPSMSVYDETMKREMDEIQQRGISHAVFGDIFLEDLRQYREEKLKEAGLTGIFPLWKQDTRQLVNEFIDLGFKAITLCVDERFLDQSFVGRIIDQSFVNDLPKEVDPCGENGEFHSFVFDGPIFKTPVVFKKGEITYRKYNDPQTGGNQKTGFWYQDLETP